MRVAFSPPYSPSKKHHRITYAITLTDPDAPSREDPSWSEFCHWVAAGVLKPALCDPRDPSPCAPVLSHLREVVPYKPPAPPEGTGFHRYVLLAFVPSNGTTEELHLSKPGERKRWGYESGSGQDGDGGGGDAGSGGTKGVRQWAEENGLAPVGKFSGGCLFARSTWDVVLMIGSRSQLYLRQAPKAVRRLCVGIVLCMPWLFGRGREMSIVSARSRATCLLPNLEQGGVCVSSLAFWAAFKFAHKSDGLQIHSRYPNPIERCTSHSIRFWIVG